MTAQYIRQCNLVVSNAAGEGLDLSTLRITFAIKKTDGQTPNTATIRVYGLSENAANQIQAEFTQVDLQAGYQSNFGVIFSGTAKRIRKGRESNVDSFLEIQAADGDGAYNFAVVNATISAGATQRDQIEQAAKVMQAKGVTQGYIAPDNSQALPRGKVMYGTSRDYLRQSSETVGASWSIQDGKLQLVPLTGVLPNQAVVLNSKSGLVGQPEQTNDGVKFRCLLNPNLQIAAMVQIAQKDVQQAALEESDKVPAVIAVDGFYRIIAMEFSGDTRGNDWYCEGVGLSVDSTAPTDKSVKVN